MSKNEQQRADELEQVIQAKTATTSHRSQFSRSKIGRGFNPTRK